MSLWHIAWSYLWNRRFTTTMTIVSLALSVGLISTVLTLRDETRKRFEEEGQMYDIVVGAKGNPLQLVLSCVYFMNAPLTGNISIGDYNRLKKEPDVEAVFPVSLGDSFRGFRIVGTTRDFFSFEWGRSDRRSFELATGEHFLKPFEAVMGAAVAKETGFRPGDTFVSSHGFGGRAHKHSRHPYTLVGVLERTNTPADRAIFTDLESIWVVHEPKNENKETSTAGETQADAENSPEARGQEGPRDEVTAVLVKLRSPAMRYEFREMVNKDYNAMAAIPVNQIQELYEQLLGTAKTVLLSIGYLVVIISSITIMISLYMAILQRKRDLAVMRALGASPGEIFGSVLIEAFWVTVLGIGAGWIAGTGVCYVLGSYLADAVGLRIGAVSLSADLVTSYSVVIMVGLLAGILPAFQAYRPNVARDLAEL
jgi:putative ABC transport system permease protein